MSDFKFGKIDSLKRDREIEGETGTELGISGSEITLIVLAATDANTKWKARRESMRVELNRLNNAKASEPRVRDFLAGVYAETLIKDWRGVVDDADPPNAIPFSREAAKALLIEADDIFAAVDAIVYDTKNFRGSRIEARVDALKN